MLLFARHLNPPLHDHLMAILSGAGFAPEVVYRTAQAQLGPDLVAQGVGLFVHASYVVREPPAGVVVRPLGGFDNRLRLAAVWRGDGAPRPSGLPRGARSGHGAAASPIPPDAGWPILAQTACARGRRPYSRHILLSAARRRVGLRPLPLVLLKARGTTSFNEVAELIEPTLRDMGFELVQVRMNGGTPARRCRSWPSRSIARAA